MVAVIYMGTDGGTRGPKRPAHNALPDRRARASSPAPGAARTLLSPACGVHYRGRTGLGCAASRAPQAPEGRVSALTTLALALCGSVNLRR